MDASGLADFNADKAATQDALWPATVIFQKTGPSTSYTCAFGETANDGALREDGQAVQEHRLGWLFWTIIAATDAVPNPFTPALLQVFKVVASTQPAFVGKSYQIDEIVGQPGEPKLKFRCHRIS